MSRHCLLLRNWTAIQRLSPKSTEARLWYTRRGFCLISQGHKDPWHESWHEENFKHDQRHPKCFQFEGLSEQSCESVSNVSQTSCMSFSLPKSSLQVSAIARSCLQVELVEWSVDWNSNGLSLSLPNSFLCGVEILSDGFFNGVPEADSLSQIKADRIVWQGESDSCEWE